MSAPSAETSLPVVAPQRRVLCLVMPNLACELVLPQLQLAVRVARASAQNSRSNHARGRGARQAAPKRLPALAVVITDQPRDLGPDDTLDAVNETARRHGITPGQSIAEARVRLSQLQVRAIPRLGLQQALERIAEAVSSFGITVAVQVPDTVCVDITGVPHLFGGEQALAQLAAAQVQALGHCVRAVVASGPVLAQAFARWGQFSSPKQVSSSKQDASQGQGGLEAVRCLDSVQLERELHALPIAALPLPEGQDEIVTWLMRCGLYSVGDLQRLPQASLSARLGEHAKAVLDFIAGTDCTPLNPHRPAPVPSESFESEEGLRGVEPLLFVLKGLAARLGARLQGRGEAARSLNLRLSLDPSIAALNGVEAEVRCNFELPSPIHRPEEIERIVSARSKRLQLPAPVLVIELQASGITAAQVVQLDLTRVLSGAGNGALQGPETIGSLCAEIAADIGVERVGRLIEVPAHRPESKSVLRPLSEPKGQAPQVPSRERQRRNDRARARAAQRNFDELLRERNPELSKSGTGASTGEQMQERDPVLRLHPTRLFPAPLPLTARFEQGATLMLGATLYSVKEIQFERRLTGVEWWSGAPLGVSRDYWRLWLDSEQGGCEVLAFSDRNTGQRYIQALYD